MRVFTAGLLTETNTFAPIPTGLRGFEIGGIYRGDASTVGDESANVGARTFRELSERDGHAFVESVFATAHPSGETLTAVYEGLRDELLADLKAKGPFDVVFLFLHGAMVAVGYEDCEADLATRVREIVGPDAVIGVELDPHCHLGQALLDAADCVVIMKEYPHTDYAERAVELYEFCTRTAKGELKPTSALFDCRMLGFYPTVVEPMRRLVDTLAAAEGEPGVLSVSFAHGFPWGDTWETGSKMLVITDDDPVMATAAAELANALTASWAALYVGAVGRAVLGAWARVPARSRSRPPTSAQVTWIRPCAGDEPGLAARLAALPRVPGQRTVFAVASEADTAHPAVETARRALVAAGHDARVMTTGAVGPNRKADQLERVLAALAPQLAPDEQLVFADSDVDLREVDLPALLAPLDDPAVGASWAAPVESGPRETAGDALSHAVLATTLHAFPLLGALDRGALVGKLFALRADVVPVAFAAPSLRRSIGEDHALGERLVRAGYRLALTPVLARSQARGRSLETVRDRYRRWLLVVRAQRSPLLFSYPLLLAAGPAWLATGVVALATGARGVALAASIGLVARIVAAFAARRFTASDLSAGATLAFALRGDLLLLGCTGRALVQRRIRWRDRDLVVGAGGQLVEEGAPT